MKISRGHAGVELHAPAVRGSRCSPPAAERGRSTAERERGDDDNRHNGDLVIAQGILQGVSDP